MQLISTLLLSLFSFKAKASWVTLTQGQQEG